MLDIGLVAAMLMPPRAQASMHLVAAVGHLPDQRLGDGEDPSRAAGEVEVVMDVCARQLAKLGMTAILGSRDRKKGAAAATKLASEGIEAPVVALDVTDAASVAAVR